MKFVGNEIGDISREQTMKGLVNLAHFFYDLLVRSQEKCLGGDSGNDIWLLFLKVSWNYIVQNGFV